VCDSHCVEYGKYAKNNWPHIVTNKNMIRIETFDQFKALPEKMKITRIRQGQTRHFYMAGLHPMTDAVMLIDGGNVSHMDTIHKNSFSGTRPNDVWLCHKDNSDYDPTMSGGFMLNQLFMSMCSVDRA